VAELSRFLLWGSTQGKHGSVIPNLSADTIPKLLLLNYKRYGDKKTAFRKKEYGIWQEHTWSDCYRVAKHLSLGLMKLGLKWGDKVSIIGDNDPHWIWAEWATMCAGGVSTGIYQDCLAAEVEYALGRSESRFVIAEDQEQVDKILASKASLPNLQKVVYWDPKGMTSYDDPLLISFNDVVGLGAELDSTDPQAFEKNVDRITQDDLARISWTSGTTAFPKGVVCSHAYPVNMARLAQVVTPLYENDEYYFASPLAWESLMAGRCLLAGGVMNFPENSDTMQADLREVAPHAMIIVPRLLEGMLSSIQVRIDSATFLKRWAYRLLMPVGFRVADLRLAGQKPGPVDKILYFLGNLVLFRPIRDSLGFTRVRSFLVGGARIGEDLFRFYHAIGIELRAMYALMEGGGYLTTHKENDVRIGTAGTPSPGVFLRICDDGEILAKSPAMFKYYYGDPEATAKTLDSQGWIHTGDAGVIEQDGHLICVDRMQDVMTLASGAKVAPGYIESSLKFSPYVKDAAVVGDKRSFVSALISIDSSNASNWADRQRIDYTTFADLSQKPEIYELVLREISRVNKNLPSATQVRAFTILHKELDADDAELTRTRKVRRQVIAEKYAFLVNALYGDSKGVDTEIEVRYRDGRKAITRAHLRIVRTEGEE